MHRRHVAPLVLASLLVLSGCSGLFGGNATPTPSPEPATPTEAPFTYPAGYSESGITDSSAAIDSHVDGILSYDSYTFSYRATIDTPNRTVRVNLTQTVNTTAPRAYVITTIGPTEAARYYANGTVYRRTESPTTNETRYSSTRQQLNLESVTGKQFLAPVLANVSYGRATTVQRDGRTLARYEGQKLTNASGLLGRNVSRDSVTSFSVTVVVGTDGVVRHVEYRATIDRPGGERQLTVVIDVSKLGSTTVVRPDWVDKAASS